MINGCAEGKSLKNRLREQVPETHIKQTSFCSKANLNKIKISIDNYHFFCNNKCNVFGSDTSIVATFILCVCPSPVQQNENQAKTKVHHHTEYWQRGPVSTVSGVLNNKDDVSQGSFIKVQQVIEVIRYVSNLAAHEMRSHRISGIGLLLSDGFAPYCT